MARTSRVICGLALAALPGGCASLTPVPTHVPTTGMANPELALQNSLVKVRSAMLELNGMYVTPGPAQPPIVPAELNRPINFTWHGPLDEGVRRLADRVGYRVSVTAPQNSRPLVVWVNVSNVTALDAFHALGNAAGSGATVIVSPQYQLVEVAHHA
jgi:defect in organelle trafficking protein DotD